LTALAFAFLALAAAQPKLLALSAAALLGVAVVNRKLYTFFFQKGGLLFAAACVPLHLLYYLYSGLSYFYVWAECQLKGIEQFNVRRSKFDARSSKEISR
jgi:hypothetical protein